MRINLKNRDFASMATPSMFKIEVTRMRWSDRGGCDSAELKIWGTQMELWQWLNYLRYAIEISDDHGTPVWWGYIHQVTAPSGRWNIGATLDGMYNRVKTAYSLLREDSTMIGARVTTAWAYDQESIDDYGLMEFLSTQGLLSAEAAEALRDAILDVRSGPQGIVDPYAAGDPNTATVICRGWGYTMGWRYASIAAVTATAISTTSATEQAVGAAAANTRAAEVWNIAQAANAVTVSIYGRKQGSPTDNLVLSIYAVDDNDVPTGSALGSVSIAGSTISSSLGWISGTLSSAAQLKTHTDYALVVSRSGSVNATNYYVVNANEADPSTWPFKLYDGSSWANRSPAADMPFLIGVNNQVESTQQIRDLVLSYAPLIDDVEIDVASGYDWPSFRDGDTTAKAEVETLLDVGGVNGRRLLYRIDPNRRMWVWEEPDVATVEYSLDAQGKLRITGNVIPELIRPVGVWCKLVDVIPGVVDVVRLNHPEIQYIQAATWTPKSGWTPEFRGTRSPGVYAEVQR